MKTRWFVVMATCIAAMFIASTVTAAEFTWHITDSSHAGGPHESSEASGNWELSDNWTTDSGLDYPDGVGHVAKRTGSNSGDTTFRFDNLTEITLGQFLYQGASVNFDNAVLQKIIWDNDGDENEYGTTGALFDRTGAWRTFNVNPMPVFQLDDDLTMRFANDRHNYVNGAIIGDGKLTVVSADGDDFVRISGTNTYSGGTVLIGDGGPQIQLHSSSALGTGDSVRIQGDANVEFDEPDILVANSTLYIDDNTVSLTFNANQSLPFYLNIDNVLQEEGVYEPADFGWSGSGTLNVIPEPGTIGLALFGVVAFLIRRRFVKVS